MTASASVHRRAAPRFPLARGAFAALAIALAAGCTTLAPPAGGGSTTSASAGDLVGTRWRAVGIHDGRSGVAPVLPDATVTLAFGPDARVGGSAGCNRYSAGYTTNGDRLAFRGAASTRMMCPGVEIMGQEQAFLRALQRVATVRRAGDRLELADDSGAVVLALVRDGAG
jgi:heat shock protein HslJ